jgi:nitrite reductase/ring-hydroxylating ferredoxin subunit
MSEQPKWREDFPIELAQDEYVSRREFTKFMVLISFALVTGQFWIMVINWMRKRRGNLPLVEIANSNDLQPGDSRIFQYPKKHDPCILVRVNESHFVAYSQKCTHLSCPIIPKPQQGEFHCPCHEGSFDLISGEPLAGPPRRPLVRVKLEFRNNRVFASGLEGEA